FLRGEDTHDVLGEYFNLEPGAPPPNIVFLGVEGLGRAFSGPNAYLGSFTPFLDELAGQSLYFENFLASQGRTFASLPSILGSLPFAVQGFNSFGSRMPKSLTLLSILKRSGYRTRFFCGTRLDFDHQGDFLAQQDIDLMVGIGDYDASYYRLPGSDWGYADQEILRKALLTERHDLHHHRGSPAGGDSTVHPDRPLPCAAHHLLAAPQPPRADPIDLLPPRHRADAAGVPAASLRAQRAGSGDLGRLRARPGAVAPQCPSLPPQARDHEPRPIRLRDVLSRCGCALRHREGPGPRAGPGRCGPREAACRIRGLSGQECPLSARAPADPGRRLH